jgi:pimeloyl-ACP methyl ester carboxylesterase
MESLAKVKYESEVLDERARVSIGGAFAKLSHGYTYYKVLGKESDPPVVLVHGFSSPSFVWDETMSRLHAAGFRAICYDLYGRGFSDRPKTRYDENLFDQQLLGLLEFLHLTKQKVHLVGSSMGGAIVVNFADKHPDLVASLSLVDPAGFPMKIKAPTGILKVPGLNKLIFAMVGNKVLIKGLTNNFYKYNPYPDYANKFQDQMRYQGFRNAILSTMNQFPLEGLAAVYDRVGTLSMPKLLFWGDKDNVIPFDNSQLVRAALPGIQFHVIPDCGHMPNVETPELFTKLLIEFLKTA